MSNWERKTARTCTASCCFRRCPNEYARIREYQWAGLLFPMKKKYTDTVIIRYEKDMGIHEMKKMFAGETAHDVLIHPAWDLLSRPRFWPATTPLTDFFLVLAMKGTKNVMNFTANDKIHSNFRGNCGADSGTFKKRAVLPAPFRPTIRTNWSFCDFFRMRK